jgi:transposase
MDGEQTTIEPDGLVRSGHTGGHTTARTQRIEVITRGERRRRWSIKEKREIVAASLRPGIRPSEVLRKYGISSGQLYAWRQQLTRRLGGELPRPAASFARVDAVVAQRQEKADPIADATTAAVAAAPWSAPPRAEGLIEIVLPGGASVRVDAQVDGRALRRVLGALYER